MVQTLHQSAQESLEKTKSWALV